MSFMPSTNLRPFLAAATRDASLDAAASFKAAKTAATISAWLFASWMRIALAAFATIALLLSARWSKRAWVAAWGVELFPWAVMAWPRATALPRVVVISLMSFMPSTNLRPSMAAAASVASLDATAVFKAAKTAATISAWLFVARALLRAATASPRVLTISLMSFIAWSTSTGAGVAASCWVARTVSS